MNPFSRYAIRAAVLIPAALLILSTAAPAQATVGAFCTSDNQSNCNQSTEYCNINDTCQTIAPASTQTQTAPASTAHYCFSSASECDPYPGTYCSTNGQCLPVSGGAASNASPTITGAATNNGSTNSITPAVSNSSGGITPAVSNTPSGITPAVSNTGGSGLTSPLKDTDLTSLLTDLLNFAITIGGIAVVLMLVFVGFKFVAAQGKASELEEARNMLLWTVIGALILLGAKAIEAGIQATVSSLSV